MTGKGQQLLCPFFSIARVGALLLMLSDSAVAFDEKLYVKLSTGYSVRSDSADTSQGTRALFSGMGPAVQAELRSGRSAYGLGVKVSIEQSQLTNLANSTSSSEFFDSQNLVILPRVYALDLYLGLGATIDSYSYRGPVDSQTPSAKFTGPGYRLEIGYDWFFTKTLFLNPEISLQRSLLISDQNSDRLTYDSVAAQVRVGVAF